MANEPKDFTFEEFIERLMEAGWERDEAVTEWGKIQEGAYDES